MLPQGSAGRPSRAEERAGPTHRWTRPSILAAGAASVRHNPRGDEDEELLARPNLGLLAEQIPEVEGTAVITGNHEAHFRVARFDTSVRFPFLTTVQKLTYGADGTFYYLINWNEKRVYEGLDRRVTGHGGRAAQRIGLREFVHETPFSDEIRADTVALLAEERIGNEPCYVVDVVYADSAGRAVWYFSKSDYLPRRVDHIYNKPRRGVATFVVELYDVEPDPEIESGEFTLQLPDGFDKSARSAPELLNLPR